MKFYFDMDGVLADWVSGFESTFSISYKDFDSLPKPQYKDFKKKIASVEDFFLNLPPFKESVEHLKSLVELGYDVEILTSVGKLNSERVIEEKKAWLVKHGINVPFNYTLSSSEKAQYANENTLLIDDRVKSVEPFKKAGGRVIHFKTIDDLKGLV